MKTYTTVQGDMWDSIAFTQLGDVAHTVKLMNANLRYGEYYTTPACIAPCLRERPGRTSERLLPWKGGRRWATEI